MSSSKRRRVKRGPPPKKQLKRRNYRDALPELMRDFGGRCAYSMQHYLRCGLLEVDHFDPRLKNEVIQDYGNLFPASRHCNGKKSDTWPTREDLGAGCRFLNPCEEVDYGEQIFEDPDTHRLVGVTPAAIWHIRICGLNADHLVHERRRRAAHWAEIKRTAILVKGEHQKVGTLIKNYREEVELMIPEIPAPPVAEGRSAGRGPLHGGHSRPEG
jgi:hypothetical protein